MSEDRSAQDGLPLSFVSQEDIDDEQIRQLEIRRDLGANLDSIGKKDSFKRRVFEFIYEPRTEVAIFILIVLSIIILIIEVSLPESGPVDWMGNRDAKVVESWFFKLDVTLSFIFGLEYLTKLWIAPRKWYFIRHNWIDLLALLPILRVFRIGRAVRLLRLLRLLRLIRIGHVIQQRISDLNDELQRRAAENMVIFIYLIFSLIFGTVGVMVFEKGNNDGFKHLGDGLWWCVVTLTTVGYGDLSPKTPGGKVVAGIIMFIGLSFYALLTGMLSSIIIERTRRNESNNLEILSLQDHVVICGWNETGRLLVKDLIESPQDPDIIVLLGDSEHGRIIDPNVRYLEEDPTTASGLDRALTKKARVVVVLAQDDLPPQDADARTILNILAVEQLNPQIHTVAELHNDENIFHARNAGCDEVLISGAYMGTVISQSVQNPGVSDVYNHLFTPGEGGQFNERTIEPSWVGMRFSEIAAACQKAELGVLLGFARERERFLVPMDDPKLKSGDRLILVESPKPHLQRLKLKRPRRKRKIEAPS